MVTTLAKSLRDDHVSELRLRDICSVTTEMPVRDAVQCMIDRKTGFALVMDSAADRLVGIFTERDYLSRVVLPGLDLNTPVRDAMSPSPRTVNLRDPVHTAIELMESTGYRHIPVMEENGKPVGVLSVKDVIHYLCEYFPANIYNLPPTPDHKQPAREGA